MSRTRTPNVGWLLSFRPVVNGTAMGSTARHDADATVIAEGPNDGFVLTDKHGDKTYFDSSGWILRREDLYGNEQTYSFTEPHKIQSVHTSLDDHTTTYHWGAGDDADRVIGIEDFTGRQSVLDYGANHNLAQTKIQTLDVRHPRLASLPRRGQGEGEGNTAVVFGRSPKRRRLGRQARTLRALPSRTLPPPGR